MRPSTRHHRLALVVAAATAAGSAHAVDGVTLIDQGKAMAGNVTPGDAPGFPVTISRSGSYRLSGNLSVDDATLHAVHITADNVSLDLNGFTIRGPVTCSGATPATITCAPASGYGNGVYASDRRSVVVRNGSVRGFHVGVRTSLAAGRIESLDVSHTRELGIAAYGNDWLVAGNTVSMSGHGGITSAGLVRDNSVSMTRSAGIFLANGALATGNRVHRSGYGTGMSASSSSDRWSAAFNAISGGSGTTLWNAYSLGGGNTNLCNGQPC